MLPHQALTELSHLMYKHYQIKYSEEELLEEAKDLLSLYAFSQGRLELISIIEPLQGEKKA